MTAPARLRFQIEHQQYRCSMASLTIAEWLDEIEAEAREQVLTILDEEAEITHRRRGHATDLKFNVRQRLRERDKA